MSSNDGEHLLLPAAKAYYETLKGLPHLTTLTPVQLREAFDSTAAPLPAHLELNKVFEKPQKC